MRQPPRTRRPLPTLLGLAWAVGAATACSGEPAAQAGPAGNAERGLALLRQYQCGSCHAVPGAPTETLRMGPPLQGFGRASYIAGRIPNQPGMLERWLQNQQTLVPDTAMPDLGVSAADARDLAAYLRSLE